MAKIDPKDLVTTNLPRAKGAFYTRSDPRLGPIAQAWPRPGAFKTNSPYAWFHRHEFGLAAYCASRAIALDIEQAKNFASETEYVYRDILMMAQYGKLFDFRDWTGGVSTPNRMVNANPQLILDQITTTWPSLLYRGGSGWIAIQPTGGGQVLKTTDTGFEFEYPGNPIDNPTIYRDVNSYALPAGSTTNTPLANWSLPANSFTYGDCLTLRAGGYMGNNTNTKRCGIEVDGTEFAAIQSGQAGNNGWFLELKIWPYTGTLVRTYMIGFIQEALTWQWFANSKTFDTTITHGITVFGKSSAGAVNDVVASILEVVKS